LYIFELNCDVFGVNVFAHISAVPKSQQRCKFVPDFVECIVQQNEKYQDFWFNQDPDQLQKFMNYDSDFLQFHFSLDYNTIQLISNQQLYEFYPRKVLQFAEQEVQITESNPINEEEYHFQKKCTFLSIFRQQEIWECNKNGD
jgi:hypothetical protein